MGGFDSEALAVTITGLLTVFGVLALISLVVVGFRRLDERWREMEDGAEQAAREKAPTIDQTTLVLIAAAAATVVAGRFRVRRIRLLSPHAQRTPWSAQGRLILQGSHSPRSGGERK